MKKGDVVEIIDHADFPAGKQFTIKKIRKCQNIHTFCESCPGQIELVEMPGYNHCFGWTFNNKDYYLCKLADFNLELPL